MFYNYKEKALWIFYLAALALLSYYFFFLSLVSTLNILDFVHYIISNMQYFLSYCMCFYVWWCMLCTGRFGWTMRSCTLCEIKRFGTAALLLSSFISAKKGSSWSTRNINADICSFLGLEEDLKEGRVGEQCHLSAGPVDWQHGLMLTARAWWQNNCLIWMKEPTGSVWILKHLAQMNVLTLKKIIKVVF